VTARCDARLHQLPCKEIREVGPELREVLGACVGLVLLQGFHDERLGDARMHLPGGAFPHQNRITLLAEVATVRVPQDALARVGRREAQQERLGAEGEQPRIGTSVASVSRHPGDQHPAKLPCDMPVRGGKPSIPASS
jgi:hypothetical protein